MEKLLMDRNTEYKCKKQKKDYRHSRRDPLMDPGHIYGSGSERRRRYLAWGAGLMLIGLLSAAALLSYAERVSKTTEHQARQILKDASERNARMLEYEINNKLTLFQRIAAQYKHPLQDGQQETLETLEPLIELYDFESVGIILPDGTSWSADGRTYDFLDQEFLQQAVKGQVGVSPTMTDSESGLRVNLYTAPIVVNGENSGAIFAVYQTQKFTDLFSAPFDKNSYSYVTDSSGQIMIAENDYYKNLLEGMGADPEQDRSQLEQMSRDMQRRQEGSISYFAEEMKYAYYRPMNINDWYVVTVVPVQAAMERYEPIIDSTKMLCAFIGFAFCVGAGLILWQQRNQNRRLEYYAYVDPLTGGKNNTCFLLDAVSVLRSQKEAQAAILAVDINRFKMINELLGVEAGNDTIRGLEQILLENSTDGEVVGHRTADRFLVLWLYRDREELRKRLEQLCIRLENLSANMENIHFQTAVGVHEIHQEERSAVDTLTIEQLCGSAMLAAQTLKGGHTTAYCFSSEEMKERQLKNKRYEDEMHLALKRHEFVPWFQPKVDLKTGRICGAEALVRWQKQDGTLVFPGDFVPFFEANGFIEKIDRAVMDGVCERFRQWKEKKLQTVPVSVNLSRTYLYSENFARESGKYLQEKQLSAGDIQFEVTETYAARDMELLKRAIHALHAEGFTVLLDDFGTGYSSLLSLQELEFDVLKLDCEFVWGIGEERAEKILEATIALAKSLHMKMIAEGVETERQYEYLKKHGVAAAQGYYYYRPMPAEEFEKLLEQA